MGRAKSFRYWMQGLWLRLIRAPKQGAWMPFGIAMIRALPRIRQQLLEDTERNNPLFDRLVRRANEKANG